VQIFTRYCDSSRIPQGKRLVLETDGSISPSYTAWSYHFSKFSLTLRSVSHSLWTTLVVYGCQCSSSVEIRDDAAGMPVCI